LKACDPPTRLKWERYFRLILLQKKEEQLLEKKNPRRVFEKEKISEIWKVDILPNWEAHWDYRNTKPKGFSVMQSKGKNMEAPKGNGFWSFFKRGRKSESPNKSQNLKGEKHLVLDEMDDTDFELTRICKNKSLLLVTLWKKGIPDWLRNTLWPICIGNQLEVNQFLKSIMTRLLKLCMTF
jgi:hypothetical protein